MIEKFRLSSSSSKPKQIYYEEKGIKKKNSVYEKLNKKYKKVLSFQDDNYQADSYVTDALWVNILLYPI